MKQFTQKLRSGEINILDVPVPGFSSNQVLVQNYYSLISAGTEGSTVKAARKGLIGKAKERPQQVKQVIDTLKTQGPVQTYRAVMKKLDAYSPLGYSCVGKVLGVGEEIRDVRVGDVVACGGASACHADVVAVPGNLCVKVPQSAERKAHSAKGIGHSEERLRAAAYNTLGAIALQGVRQADLRLGECCAVIGLGLLGHLTCLLLRASGVRVIGIDIERAMVEMAGAHCADVALNRGAAGIEELIGEVAGGIGCDGVIITAAADSVDPINFAGAIARKGATIVVVGSVPTGFDRDPHYYKKELTVKMSCSYGPGRYDPEYEEKGRDYPVGYVRWTERRNMEAFQQLIAEEKIDVSYLTTHVFSLEQSPKAYDMIVEKTEPYLGILIDYRKEQSAEHRAQRNPPITQTTQKKNVSRKDAKTLRSELAADERRYTQTKVIVKPSAISHQPSAISIGFMGAGSYAQSFLLPNVPKSGTILRGVMTSSSASARTVADRFGFEFCTTSEDDILGDPDIQVVFVATRHNTHGEFVIKALQHGKHVFVEKPLCLNLEQLKEIQAAYGSWLMAHGENGHQPLATSHQLLMVGYNRRFSPLSKFVKHKIGSGPMAMLYRVNAGTIPADSWIQDRSVGGGRILGEVCHFVDYLTFLCGSLPKSVSAHAIPDPAGLNDTLSISLSFENGSVGSIQYVATGSKALPKEYVEVHIHGLSVTLNDYRHAAVFGTGKPQTKKLMVQDKGQPEEVRVFIDAAKRGLSSPVPLEDILRGMETCFAIEESIRTGQTVNLN